MRLKYTLTIAFAFFASIGFSQRRGDLISSELVSTITKNQINFIYSILNASSTIHPIDYEVELYKIDYWTPEPRGQFLTQASGLLYVPIATCDFPVVSYHHGTTIYGEESSAMADLSYIIPIPFATGGYIVCMADYVGYGSTPDSIPHAYLHAESEATAVIDMLVAAEQLCASKEVGLNGQLFLAGYSQGGHVTMAAHRELQEGDYKYTVTASASGSGPYQLDKIARDSVLTSVKFSSPTYTTFLLESYKYIYNVQNLDNTVYKSPYKEKVPQIYNRQSPGDPTTLPVPAFDYLSKTFVDSVLNGTSQFNTFLEENEVYKWVPTSPVRLFYCTGDDQVPYTISIFTADTMKKLGAVDLEVIQAAENLSHIDCYFPAANLMKIWFDQQREKCIATGVSEEMSEKVNVFSPNVVDDYVTINESIKTDEYQVFNLSGVAITSGKINNHSIDLKSLKAGMYLLILDSEKHLFYKK